MVSMNLDLRKSFLSLYEIFQMNVVVHAFIPSPRVAELGESL